MLCVWMCESFRKWQTLVYMYSWLCMRLLYCPWGRRVLPFCLYSRANSAVWWDTTKPLSCSVIDTSLHTNHGDSRYSSLPLLKARYYVTFYIPLTAATISAVQVYSAVVSHLLVDMGGNFLIHLLFLLFLWAVPSGVHFTLSCMQSAFFLYTIHTLCSALQHDCIDLYVARSDHYTKHVYSSILYVRLFH